MAYTQLTEIERYQIFSLKEVAFTQRLIATSLSRDPSTISQELRRNRKTQKYCPKQAQLKASEHRHSAIKAVKVTPEITKWVNQLIWQDLNPEKTVGYLKREKKISYIMKRYGSYERKGKIKKESVLINNQNLLIKSNVLVIGNVIPSLEKIIKVHY
ncbi:transposase [Xenorhabdus sp. PB62.4]|nr:transposase [Xenorhabdus sp. PB62.4]